MDIKYSIQDGIDKLFDEKGNTFLALRKISWGESTNAKYDLRKWYISKDGNGETVGKGFSFLTDDGPSELTHVLLESGFGETKKIIDTIKTRDDFNSSLVNSLSKKELSDTGLDIGPEEDDEDLYDPSAIFE